MSSNRATFVRAMHDLGAASWFGGSLMGATGLNGASADTSDGREALTVATSGWARWSPVAAASIGLHLVGGAGLLLDNRTRARHQDGVRANTVTKLVLTGAALATTAYSGVLGGKIAQHLKDGDTPAAHSATAPRSDTPSDLAEQQKQLRILQWATPVLVGAVIVLGAQQGEQQRASQVVKGLFR